MHPYLELSANAQNAYADLFDSALALSISSTVAGLNGSFGTKRVHGKNYWYFQYRDLNGKVKQLYVGPESVRLTELISSHDQQPTVPLQRLAAAAIALGCEPMLPKHFRVIRRLAEYGFFRRGGILVGTHAFLAMANMLGIAPSEKMQTQDVDFAHAGKNISIAMPANIRIEAATAIESLEMGLLPISTVGGGFGATYLNPADPTFRIDFLTARNSESDEPVFVEGLAIALQPLKFMEFSMVDTLQAAVFCNEGAVVANIPNPARFAIHKLIVSSERKLSDAAKISKDVRQANVLIQYYLDHRPAELIEVVVDAASRGPGWRRRLEEGGVRLGKVNPEAGMAIQEELQRQSVKPGRSRNLNSP